MVQKNIDAIDAGKSNIRDYGATIATEYFFERPKLLKRRHPELFHALEGFYQQNHAQAKQSKAKAKSQHK